MEHKQSDLNLRIEDFTRQIIELNDAKSKLTSQNSEYYRRNASLEYELQQANLNVKKITQELDEVRTQLETETSSKSSLELKNKNLLSDYESVKGQVEEENEIKLELQKQITRLQEEARFNREKLEKECNSKLEELEDSK